LQLVTGANGFIGKAIVSAYGADALAVSRRPAANADTPNQISFDISNVAEIHTLIDKLRSYDITEVIHTAAVTPWAPHPDFSVDLRMAEALTMLCNELHIPRLTFLSGWIVYDMQQGEAPFDESTPLGPTIPYGQSKLAVEQYFAAHLESTVVVSARLASVYGPGQTSAGLIPNFVAAALKGETLSVASKETRRDYLYIDDVTEALRQLSTQAITKHTAINLGSGSSVTVLEVAQTIAELCKIMYNQTVPIATPTPATEATPRNNQLAITKAQSLGALLKTTSLTDGLRAFITWRTATNEKTIL
jgi:nucleoside-diphosphate-sugar epimerase